MKRIRAIFLASTAFAILSVASPLAAQISLGTAQSFGVLGGPAVTNTGATIINGNVGVSPGSSISGFPPGLATGTHNNDATARTSAG